MRKFLSVLLAMAMVLSLTVTSFAADTAADAKAEMAGKTVILHTNDVHGAVEGYAYIVELKADYEAKVAEVMDAVERVGGKPCAVDMVTNIGLLKEGRFDAYTRDIAAVVGAVEGRGIVVKAILETSLLDAEEIRTACRCAAEAGVDYVKTSTGRAGAPALSHIRVMREALPEGVGVKFSGFGTLNAPELALWAFFLGADVLGSPCGNVIVDTLASGYAEVGMQGPR